MHDKKRMILFEILSGIVLGVLVAIGIISAISNLSYNPKSDTNKSYFVYQGY